MRVCEIKFKIRGELCYKSTYIPQLCYVILQLQLLNLQHFICIITMHQISKQPHDEMFLFGSSGIQ